MLHLQDVEELDAGIELLTNLSDDVSVTALAAALDAEDDYSLATSEVGDPTRVSGFLGWYRGGQPAAVVEAKYKAEKPAGFPDADLYQMLAYCAALDLREGHLVYARGSEPETTHEIRNVVVSIRTHALDLSKPASRIVRQVRSVASCVAAVHVQANA